MIACAKLFKPPLKPCFLTVKMGLYVLCVLFVFLLGKIAQHILVSAVFNIQHPVNFPVFYRNAGGGNAVLPGQFFLCNI